MKRLWIIAFILIATQGFGQEASPNLPSTATVRQLMLDMIYPASNDLLLIVDRGGPKDAAEWAAARRDALNLSESGNLLMMPGRSRDQEDWVAQVKTLVAVGTSAYKAAGDKNLESLAAATGKIDAACTSCHKEYRPNVFPRQGGSK